MLPWRNASGWQRTILRPENGPFNQRMPQAKWAAPTCCQLGKTNQAFKQLKSHLFNQLQDSFEQSCLMHHLQSPRRQTQRILKFKGTAEGMRSEHSILNRFCCFPSLWTNTHHFKSQQTGCGKHTPYPLSQLIHQPSCQQMGTNILKRKTNY